MIWLMGRSNREYHPRETSPGGESGLHSVSAFVTVSIKTSSPTARGGVSPATLVRTAVLVPLTASEARLVGCVNLKNRVPMTMGAAFWAEVTSRVCDGPGGAPRSKTPLLMKIESSRLNVPAAS